MFTEDSCGLGTLVYRTNYATVRGAKQGFG